MDELLQEMKEIKQLLQDSKKYGLSVKEASIYSGIGQHRINYLCEIGELEYKEITPHKKIITKDALKEYLNS